MILVVDKFQTLLPPRKKTSPSGWTSFNAPCCQHRGHKPDTRKRAGVRFDGLGIVYNCFNCKFSTGWQPGSPFGEKMKSLCRWLGANDDDIKDLVFESLKTEAQDYKNKDYEPAADFESKSLPEGAMTVKQWLESDYVDDVSQDLIPVVDYIYSRNLNPLDDDFYWTPADGYADRVIIAFRYQGKIVGNTARKIRAGKPKYISDQHPNFVYNLDRQREEQRYIFVVEGPFDALNIGGLALLTNEISDQQARMINALGSEVIVIPDQDRAGMTLFDQAAEHDWSVAMPNWEDDVKDVADAVDRYGKLFVIVDAIKTAQKGKIKINMAKMQQRIKLEKIENAESDN